MAYFAHARSLGAVSLAGLVSLQQQNSSKSCESQTSVPRVPFFSRTIAACDSSKPDPKAFRKATCFDNDAHTSNTRKISFRINDGSPWAVASEQAPIANVVVKADIGGAAESGCCACCKCPPPCGCPKQANGCCACCKCAGTCGCPKTVASSAPAAASGCCACCKCPQPCGCPKGPNGCCACCKCPGTCGCPKQEAPGSNSVARPYNPIDADSGSEFTLLVKKYDGGKMGGHLHGLKQGDTVEIRGPNKQWGIKPGKYNHYAFVAGGTGITPLIQAANHIMKNENAVVTFLTFNKTADDVLLRAELQSLADTYPTQMRVQHFVEQGARNGLKTSDRDSMKQTLQEHLPQPGNGVIVLVCGRKEMTEFVAGPKTPDFKQGDLGGLLKDLGYSKEHVWKV